MADLPRIVSLLKNERLYLYLATSPETVSVVLVVERENDQHPIYFISHALFRSELNYPPIEKIEYCLLLASRKLKPYFEANSISVLTNYPLRRILQRYKCA